MLTTPNIQHNIPLTGKFILSFTFNGDLDTFNTEKLEETLIYDDDNYVDFLKLLNKCIDEYEDNSVEIEDWNQNVEINEKFEMWYECSLTGHCAIIGEDGELELYTKLWEVGIPDILRDFNVFLHTKVHPHLTITNIQLKIDDTYSVRDIDFINER